MPRRELLLIHESESTCIDRLSALGFHRDRAIEIASYLAQSTDMEEHYRALEAACADYEIKFLAVHADQAGKVLSGADRRNTLAWILTDGTGYYKGTAIRHLTGHYGIPTFGSDTGAFSLCPDKFRSSAIMSALGVPAPQCGLARNGKWIVPPSKQAPDGWFVKPNSLGAKIGIESDAHCHDTGAALEISRRIHADYRDDAVVQVFAPGRNARASFLAVDPQAGLDGLGVVEVDSGGDFQTMADSLALYGNTGTAAITAGTYVEPELRPLNSKESEAVRTIAQRMVAGLGLRDVFSIDLRISENGAVAALEFEVSPGLPCFDFRHYCRTRWDMDIAPAMAAAAAAKFANGRFT